MKSIYANGKRGRTAELLNRINFAMFKTFAVYTYHIAKCSTLPYSAVVHDIRDEFRYTCI